MYIEVTVRSLRVMLPVFDIYLYRYTTFPQYPFFYTTQGNISRGTGKKTLDNEFGPNAQSVTIDLEGFGY